MSHTAVAEEIPVPPTLRPSHRRWLAVLVYAFLAVLCALAAYWLMFSQFAVYDDEGFFDYSLKLFVGGHPLYTSVFSEYGPFYYLVFGGFFAAIGHGVTTDAGRLIQLSIWVATSLGLGLVAHRLTGRLALGVAATATAFGLLNGLISEPMHAAALICALLTAMAAAVAFLLPARTRVALVVIGALAAALLLTKVNVGVYALVSIGFATVMASPLLARQSVLRWLAAAAFVLVGPAVMFTKLNNGWVRTYALLAVLSTLSLVFVALPRETGSATTDESLDWLRWLIGGFVGCAAVVLIIIFGLGSSPRALFDQIFVVPSRQSSFLTTPITLGSDVVWWSLGAAGLAWTLRQRRSGGGDTTIVPASLFGGLLRTVAGVAILMSLGSQSVFNIAPNAAFSLAMPLAWLAAVPPSPDIPTPRKTLGRVLIPALAILYCLDAFPVAGTQVLLGSILLVPCGAVCLADGWTELAAWNLDRAPRNRISTPFTALAVALAVGTVFLYIVQPLETNHDDYRAGLGLGVAGATRLHINPTQAMAIDNVVASVRSQCHTLIEFPGMYSFNLWTGLPTPSPFTGQQPYWLSLTHNQQLHVVQAAEASRGLCAIRNDTLAASYGGAPASSPIVSYIDMNFAPIAQFPPYTVLVRRPKHSPSQGG